MVARFEQEGNQTVQAECAAEVTAFTATEWNAFSEEEKQAILLDYRLTYISETEVNWCAELGTILANDEIVNGVSERGGYPVTKKKMKQWSMRIGAYAERLLQGLETIDWPESSRKCSATGLENPSVHRCVSLLDGHDEVLEVFTTPTRHFVWCDIYDLGARVGVGAKNYHP